TSTRNSVACHAFPVFLSTLLSTPPGDTGIDKDVREFLTVLQSTRPAVGLPQSKERIDYENPNAMGAGALDGCDSPMRSERGTGGARTRLFARRQLRGSLCLEWVCGHRPEVLPVLFRRPHDPDALYAPVSARCG